MPADRAATTSCPPRSPAHLPYLPALDGLRVLAVLAVLLYPAGFLLVGLCTALVIVAIAHPRARLVPRMLGWGPLRWIGVRSYGIYLWHWPVFQITRPYLHVPLDGWALLVLRLAIVAALAEGSYRLVELSVRQGAIERVWQGRPQTRRVRLTRRRLGRRWLLVPLECICTLLPTSALWLARMNATRAAAVRDPVPTTVGTRPAVTPAPAAAASAMANHMAIPSTPVASSPSTAPATPRTTRSPRPSRAVTGAAALPAAPRPGVSPAPVAPMPLDPALVAQLQHLLDDRVADGFVPGAVLSVSIPGYLPWSGASGVADHTRGLPMKPDTLVHIASITKMFTAVVVLQLAEEGRLNLDAPIDTWLPGIVRFAHTTTVRHLLSHRSGLFDYPENAQFFVPAYRNPQRTYTPAELVEMVNPLGAAFAPGTAGAWQYASTNYVILGMLVEKVTGRPLAEEIRRRIFDPLALKHTYFVPDERVQGSVAQGYIDASDRANVSMTFVFATGNIISTVDDLRRFGDDLFRGKLLKPATLAAMESVVETGGAYGMPELQYGLGLMRARLNVGPRPDGARRPAAAGTVLGHIGGIAGFRAAIWRVPASGITIALSLNQADMDPNLLARDVLQAILTWQGQ